MYVIRDHDVIETINPQPGDEIPIHPKVQIAVHVDSPFLYLKKAKLHSPHYTILDTPDGTYFLFTPTYPPYELPITLHNRRIFQTTNITKKPPIVTFKEEYRLLLTAPSITNWNPKTSIIKPSIQFPYLDFVITKRTVLNIKVKSGRPKKQKPTVT